MACPLRKIDTTEEFYTYADYLSWDDGQRRELIYGQPYLLAAPARRHQRVSVRIVRQLGDFLDGHPCEVYYAPFDVRLFAEADDSPEDVDTVVQPDILVVCDPDKLDEAGCHGAPDFIIEIVSPSTERHDRARKFALYQRACVREYWIVDPDRKTVQPYVLERGRYRAGEPFIHGGGLPVAVLEGCTIDLDRVFAE